METERVLIEKFVKYLKQNGYPEESMIYDMRLNNYFIDLAIIDIRTGDLMTIFEFVNYERKVNSVPYFSRLIKGFKAYNIPIYVVYNEENETSFIIERIDGVHETMNNEIISYKNLQSRVISIYFLEKEKEKNKIKDKLDFLCIIIGIIVFLLFILDITGFIVMTLNRIILLSIIIGFFIFPFLQSIKILGVEIERKKKKSYADYSNYKKNAS